MSAVLEKPSKALWKTEPLGEVCQLDKKSHDGAQIAYVGMEDIEGGTGTFLGKKSPHQVKSNTFRFSPSHVLYGRLRPYLNKVLLPDFEGHCSTEIFPILPGDNLDRRFLFYWLTTDEQVTRINSTCTGARMPRANFKEVLSFPIPLPPLPEQERIVSILDEAFEGIATATAHAERNLHNARELFQSVLQSTFQQKGEDWVETTLVDAVAETCTLSYGIVQPGKEYPDGLPLVRPTDMNRKIIDLQGLKRINSELATSYARTSLKGGEILLCVRGSTGMLSIASPELAGANVTRGIVPIRFAPEKVDQEFGFYLLLGPPTQTQIREKTYGAALMQINIRDLKKIALRFPSIKKQKAIVQKLDALATETRRLEAIYQRKLAALAELKQSLLQRAFAGEL